MRIVSLLPSATEIVGVLGAGGDVVGVSHECDFPEWACGLPRLTSARIPEAASSRDIDEAVRGVLRDALSIYAVDESRLAELKPDVIITQDLCEVCAVSLDDVRAAVARLAHRDDVRIVSLSPTRFDHVLGDIRTVAAALGVEARGDEVCSSLRKRLSALSSRAATATERPRVVSVEWIDPIMLGGTWMPELISAAGGDAVGVSVGAPAPTLSTDQLVALRPDVVVIKPCGFSLARSLEERSVIDEAIVSALPPTTSVYVADGNAYFNRPGPRLVESAEILAGCIHPSLFSDLVTKHAAAYVRVE